MKLPDFSLPADDGKMYTEKNFSDGIFVLYIYPKDMTPGCTTESQNFRDLQSKFEELGVKIFGLSKDSIVRHEKFSEKENLNFPLISDEEGGLIGALNVWKEKSMYGKTFMGIERSTFLIKDGIIVKEWRRVKVKGHAEEVLQVIMNDKL